MRSLLESESHGNYSGFLTDFLECGSSASAFTAPALSPQLIWEHPCKTQKWADPVGPRSKKGALVERGQFGGGFVDQRDFLLQGFRGYADLLLGFLPALEFERFADAGNGFRFITRVLAGSVNFVLEPGTPGQSVGIGQAALAFHKQMVQLLRQGGSLCHVAASVSLGVGFFVGLGGLGKLGDSVIERREIDERGDLFGFGRDRGMPGIIGGLEDALFNFPVALANLVLFLLKESFEFLHVGLHGVRKISEFERQNVRVGEPDDSGAGGLRKGAAVDKLGVAEVSEPVEIVVDGMIDAAAVFTAVAEIEGGDAAVLQETAR